MLWLKWPVLAFSICLCLTGHKTLVVISLIGFPALVLNQSSFLILTDNIYTFPVADTDLNVCYMNNI